MMESGNTAGLSIEELRSVVHALAEADAGGCSTSDNNASNSSLLSAEEQHFLNRAFASHERQDSHRQAPHTPLGQNTSSSISRPSPTTIARIGLGPSYAVSPNLEPSSASSSSSTSPLSTRDTEAATVAPLRLPPVLQCPRTYSPADRRNVASRPPLSSSTTPPTSYRLREQKSGRPTLNSNSSRSTEPTPGAYSVTERASGAPPAWDWRSRQPGSYLYPPGTSADVIQAVEGRVPSRNLQRVNSSERRPPSRTISPIPIYGASTPVQATLAPSEVQVTRSLSSSSSSSSSQQVDVEAGTPELNDPTPRAELPSRDTLSDQRDESSNAADAEELPSQPAAQEIPPSTIRSETPANEPTFDGIIITNKRRKFSLWFAGALLLCLIVGVAVGVVVMSVGNRADEAIQPNSDASSAATIPISRQDRWTQFRKQLQPLSSNPSALDDPTTPQYQALAWLAFDDYDTMLIETDGEAQEIISDREARDAWFSRLEARYALAVLYFSTNGKNWNEVNHFLSPTTHECDWSKPPYTWTDSYSSPEVKANHVVIECDESFQLKSLVMSKFPVAADCDRIVALAIVSMDIREIANAGLSFPCFSGSCNHFTRAPCNSFASLLFVRTVRNFTFIF